VSLEAWGARREKTEVVGNVKRFGLDAVAGCGYGEVDGVETTIYNFPSADGFAVVRKVSNIFPVGCGGVAARSRARFWR
jgi:hypothetical protein